MKNFFGNEETDDLISVFYDNKNTFVDNNDYDQNNNIQKSNYTKIIAKLVNYYKQKIDNMILLNRNGNYKHVLGDIDCHDERIKYTKRCKTDEGGKRQKTNKKHRQCKKKTKARTKQNNKKTSKKPRKTRR